MLKIRLLKCLDRMVGGIAARLLPSPESPPKNAPDAKRILLIRPGGIGDAVHLVPAIHTLQRRFPDIAIDILAEGRNSGVFSLVPGIRRVYLYDRPGQLLRVLRTRYDAVVDTEQWHRLSAVIARLVRAPVRIGYATSERARLFTHSIPYRHDDYEVESFLHLLEPLANVADPVPGPPWLRVPVAAGHNVDELLGRDGERRLVVIFPGASIVERRWGAERFRAVAQWCDARGLRVVVVGGVGDREEGTAIVSGLDAQNFAGRTSLAETSAILERAAVVVSGDSGILHIAVGLGRPTVSLFGSGIAAKWAPRGKPHIVLNKELPCSPCTRFGYTPPCPYATRCMREISVEEVIRAVARQLDISKNGKSA